MGDVELLEVPIDVRMLRRTMWLTLAFVAALAVAAAGSNSAATRVVLLIGCAVSSGAIVGYRLRIRMARAPQVRADREGLVIATFRGPLQLSWSEVKEIGPIRNPGLFGYRPDGPAAKWNWFDRSGSWMRIGGAGRHFYVRSTIGRRALIGAPPADYALDLDGVRLQLEAMRERFRGVPPARR